MICLISIRLGWESGHSFDGTLAQYAGLNKVHYMFFQQHMRFPSLTVYNWGGQWFGCQGNGCSFAKIQRVCIPWRQKKTLRNLRRPLPGSICRVNCWWEPMSAWKHSQLSKKTKANTTWRNNDGMKLTNTNKNDLLTGKWLSDLHVHTSHMLMKRLRRWWAVEPTILQKPLLQTTERRYGSDTAFCRKSLVHSKHCQCCCY